MGVDGSKAKPPSKFQIEIMATKVRQYLNLQKDRKSNDVVKEEKNLLKLLNNPGRSKLEEYLSMERIVGILKVISADRILMSYADIVKQNSAVIAEPTKNQARVMELMPYILSIIYSSKPLGLNCMNEFKNMMTSVFGKQMIQLNLQQTATLPPDIKNCFDRITPSFQQVNQYAIEMCERNEFSMETLNAVGHNFSPYAGHLNVQPGIIPPPQNGGQGFNNGGGQGFNNGGQGFNGGNSGPNNNFGGNNNNGFGGNNNGFGGNNNFGGNGNNNFGGNNNNFGGNPYTGNQGNNFGNNNNGFGTPQQHNQPQQNPNNVEFNPHNFMPIYQPTNFDIPKNPNPNNQFNDMYVPKNMQPPVGNFNYPGQSNLYGDLDKNLDDRLKRL